MNLSNTRYLLGVLQGLKRPKRFLTELAFSTVVPFDTEAVTIDVKTKRRRLAPFVSPLVAGKVLREQAWSSNTFTPAYLKPINALTPKNALKRLAGETIGGDPNMTPGQRMQIRLAEILMDQYESIIRRIESMGAEVLRLASCTVTGEGYDTKVLTFGRNPDLRTVLGGGDLWTDPDSDPLGDIRRQGSSMHKIEGAVVTDIVFEPDGWDVFLSHPKVQEYIKLIGGLNTKVEGTDGFNAGIVAYAGLEGVDFKGKIGNVRYWAYEEFYEDADGLDQPLIPSGEVIFLGTKDYAGSRLHGAILDEFANYQPAEVFPRSWVENNPTLRMIMTQSAPLPAPGRVNASSSMKVT